MPQIAIPQTMDDVLDPNFSVEPAALAAAKKLARAKPWRGGFDERYKSLHVCFVELRAAYGIEGWDLVHIGRRAGCSGQSRIDARRRRIVLAGRLSVVTMLHLFAKVRRMVARMNEPLRPVDHFKAIRWSVNLFKRVFPLSFSRCRLVQGLLVNDGRRDD